MFAQWCSLLMIRVEIILCVLLTGCIQSDQPFWPKQVGKCLCGGCSRHLYFDGSKYIYYNIYYKIYLICVLTLLGPCLSV